MYFQFNLQTEACSCKPQNMDFFGGLSALGQSLGQNLAPPQSNPINSILSIPTSMVGTALQTLRQLPLVGFMFSG